MENNLNYLRRKFLKYSITSGLTLILQNILIKPTYALELNKNNSTNLEKIIESHIKNLRIEGIISEDEISAWSVYDFTTKEKLVSINENEPFQAASMIKPLVALAYFDRVAKGILNYTKKVEKYLKLMIEKSDNSATNKIMALVGGPKKVNSVLKNNYSEILDSVEVVETIPTGKYTNGQTYKNKATAEDYNRFLYALWNNLLPFSNEIKKNMARVSKKRVMKNTSIPEMTQIYNKTGTTAMLCGDMAIFNALDIYGNRKAYSLVAMIQKETKAENYFAWREEKSSVIRSVSQIVYENMKLRHHLI